MTKLIKKMNAADFFDEKTYLFIEKSIAKHGNKYDYSRSVVVNDKEKVIIVCKIHGEFFQKPMDHKAGCGCQKCGRARPKMTTDKFILNSKRVHGDNYDYSKTVFTENRKKIIIICKIHGEFSLTAANHKNGEGCKKCGNVVVITTKSKTIEDFILEATAKHGDKYNYSEVKYDGTDAEVIIICKIHGSFNQLSSSHLAGHGCHKCANITRGKNRRCDTKTFVKKAIQKHGNKYDYSKTVYEKTGIPIIIICKIHGKFEQLPERHIFGHGCTTCAGKMKKDTDHFIKDAIEFHGDVYDYSKVDYVTSKLPVIIICGLHGEFNQTPNVHLRSGCSKCGDIRIAEGKRYTTAEYIEKAEVVHGDKFDYSKVEYVGKFSPIIIICKLHGEFIQRADTHLKGGKCTKCMLCPSCGLWKTSGKLCSYCKPKNSNKLYEKTKEMAVVKFLKDKLPDEEFIHNKSVGSSCTGGRLFPDILFDCIRYFLIIEVDEFKHRGADYECDEKRMYDIIAKLGLPCVFIRYNPDNKNSDRSVLLNMIQYYLEFRAESKIEECPWDKFGIKCEYLFY